MNLLVDYIQPLTNWLQAHPNWALLITFLIASSESLAIVGSLVPGSVTMTAVGILAGTGIMRIDLTLLSATLGAICGDSLSYFIGYYYSERLIEIWPFSKYPNLITYGKEFFTRHGGKSVLIGRFVGPLRSMIPVIAGIMHMPQWQFLLANSISGLGWAILYVIPGVIIGAAGHELSTELATRLFLLILLILVSIWVVSSIFQFLYKGLQRYFKGNLHKLWLTIHSKSHCSKVLQTITPSYEEDHYPTMGLLILSSLTLIVLILLSVLTATGVMNNYIDLPIHYFIQTINSSLFKAFFIACSQLTSPLSLMYLSVVFIIWFIYHKNTKALLHLLSLLLSCLLIAYGLNLLIHSPRPYGLLFSKQSYSFPSIDLSLFTSLYALILFYISSHYTLISGTLKSIILIILGLAGFSEIYLGDSWFSDVLAGYLLGSFLCSVHYISYRKSISNYVKSNHAVGMIATILIGTIISCSVSTVINFKALDHNHMPYLKEYLLTEEQWWTQKEPMLPIYRLNRIGKRISILNIQFVGDLRLFQANLESYGWQSHNEQSFWSKVISRMSSNQESVKLPLFSQLFENKKPELVMTFKDKKLKLILELSIWESNFHLSDKKSAVWIGSVHQNLLNTKNKSISSPLITDLNPISYVSTALNKHYSLQRIILKNKFTKPTLFPTLPYILLIKEHQDLPNY